MYLFLIPLIVVILFIIYDWKDLKKDKVKSIFFIFALSILMLFLTVCAGSFIKQKVTYRSETYKLQSIEGNYMNLEVNSQARFTFKYNNTTHIVRSDFIKINYLKSEYEDATVYVLNPVETDDFINNFALVKEQPKYTIFIPSFKVKITVN